MHISAMGENVDDYININFNEVQILEGIGKGSFGVVHKAVWRNKIVAVKRVETESEISAFQNEVHQLSRVNHENIIKMHGAFMGGQCKFLVMEFADGGSLYHLLHNPPYPAYNLGHGLSWLLQCAKAVAYLHSMEPHPIIHRDLKPPNLLLTNGWRNLKICDFGTACKLHTEMTDNKGSAAWMAPEVFEKKTYNEKCDVYSWGIILWEVLTRKVPFQDLGLAVRILWAVHNGKRPPLIQGCPKPLESLMKRCWDCDEQKRPSMDEVVATMTRINKFMKGSEDPIYFNTNSSQESITTDCEMSPLNNSSADRTSQDVSEITSMSNTCVDQPTEEGQYLNNNQESTLTKEMSSKSPEVPHTSSSNLLQAPISPNVSAVVVVDPLRNVVSPLSSDQSSCSSYMPSQKGHRRSSSQGTPTAAGWCNNTIVPSIHNTKSCSFSNEVDNIGELSNVKEQRSNSPDLEDLGEYWNFLDNDIKPVMPLAYSEESKEIFKQHKEKAKEYLVLQQEIVTLRQKKTELCNKLRHEEQIQQQNNHRYEDKIQKLQNRQDELQHCYAVLQKQINRIKRERSQTSGDHDRDYTTMSPTSYNHPQAPFAPLHQSVVPGQSVYRHPEGYYMQTPTYPPHASSHFPPYLSHQQYMYPPHNRPHLQYSQLPQYSSQYPVQPQHPASIPQCTPPSSQPQSSSLPQYPPQSPQYPHQINPQLPYSSSYTPASPHLQYNSQMANPSQATSKSPSQKLNSPSSADLDTSTVHPVSGTDH